MQLAKPDPLPPLPLLSMKSDSFLSMKRVWTHLRFAFALCCVLPSAFAAWNAGAADVAGRDSSERKSGATDTGKPGDYRLIRSNNDAICQSFAKIFAASRSKAGDLDFSKRNNRVKWKNPRPGVVLDPPMQVAEFDIDNDGVMDRVFRVAWSISSHYTYSLYVHRLSDPAEPVPVEKEGIREMLKAATRIDFRETASVINRLKSRYGSNWEDWDIPGHTAIDALRFNNKTYLIAWYYDIPLNNLARAYVFQVERDGQPIDVCMFARICPCSGCTGRESQIEEKLMPTDKYCRKP